MEYRYYPKGVCSIEMVFDIEDDIVKGLRVVSGCNGNLQGIAKLVKGMKIEDVATKLEGIECDGRRTSCPDQISKALKEFIEKQK